MTSVPSRFSVWSWLNPLRCSSPALVILVPRSLSVWSWVNPSRLLHILDSPQGFGGSVANLPVLVAEQFREGRSGGRCLGTDAPQGGGGAPLRLGIVLLEQRDEVRNSGLSPGTDAVQHPDDGPPDLDLLVLECLDERRDGCQLRLGVRGAESPGGAAPNIPILVLEEFDEHGDRFPVDLRHRHRRRAVDGGVLVLAQFAERRYGGLRPDHPQDIDRVAADPVIRVLEQLQGRRNGRRTNLLQRPGGAERARSALLLSLISATPAGIAAEPALSTSNKPACSWAPSSSSSSNFMRAGTSVFSLGPIFPSASAA